MSHGRRNQAIRALYERERERLFRVALRVGGGRRSFAEDVVHDVFIQLLQRFDDVVDGDEGRGADLGGWLYRCTMNGCLSRLRKEAVRAHPLVAFFVGQNVVTTPSADVRARLDAAQRDALDALALLPSRERVAFCMVRLDDAPLKDVAAVLACSVPTACKLVQRAEQTLQRHGWGGTTSTSTDAMPAATVVAHG